MDYSFIFLDNFLFCQWQYYIIIFFSVKEWNLIWSWNHHKFLGKQLTSIWIAHKLFFFIIKKALTNIYFWSFFSEDIFWLGVVLEEQDTPVQWGVRVYVCRLLGKKCCVPPPPPSQRLYHLIWWASAAICGCGLSPPPLTLQPHLIWWASSAIWGGGLS